MRCITVGCWLKWLLWGFKSKEFEIKGKIGQEELHEQVIFQVSASPSRTKS